MVTAMHNMALMRNTKLLYLLAVALLLFVFDQLAVISGLLVFQACLWIYSRLGIRALLPLLCRLSLFFLIIALSYAFVSTGDVVGDDWLRLPIAFWALDVNLSGLWLALVMCLRVLVLVMTSAWVQQSGKPGDFIRAMLWMRVPKFLALSVDSTLTLLAPTGGKGGNGRGRHKREKGKTSLSFQQIRRGDLSFIAEKVGHALRRAEAHMLGQYPDMNVRQARDIGIIVGISLVIMGLKALQILPGLPIAPGHKNVIIIPLFLLATQLTHMRFGGMWTGLTVGVVNFLFGFGKFGLLEVAQFALPGLLADLCLPFVRGHAWWRILQLMIVGALLGLARFTANFLVIVLAGAPLGAFLLYLPMLISQVVFGALSCFVSMALLQSTSQMAGRTDDEQVVKDRRSK